MATSQELRVGDRVRYVGNYTTTLIGVQGTVVKKERDSNVLVAWDGQQISLGVFPYNVKIIPQVGDAVLYDGRSDVSSVPAQPARVVYLSEPSLTATIEVTSRSNGVLVKPFTQIGINLNHLTVIRGSKDASFSTGDVVFYDGNDEGTAFPAQVMTVLKHQDGYVTDVEGFIGRDSLFPAPRAQIIQTEHLIPVALEYLVAPAPTETDDMEEDPDDLCDCECQACVEDLSSDFDLDFDFDEENNFEDEKCPPDFNCSICYPEDDDQVDECGPDCSICNDFSDDFIDDSIGDFYDVYDVGDELSDGTKCDRYSGCAVCWPELYGDEQDDLEDDVLDEAVFLPVIFRQEGEIARTFEVDGHLVTIEFDAA